VDTVEERLYDKSKGRIPTVFCVGTRWFIFPLEIAEKLQASPAHHLPWEVMA